jgi:hypothetical protein
MSLMTDRLERQNYWSPLCPACLSRAKSPEFRNAVLDPAKPLNYEVRKNELVNGCALCYLFVSSRLDVKLWSSNSPAASVYIWKIAADPSMIHVKVNGGNHIQIYLSTRPGRGNVSSRERAHVDL